MSLYAPGASSRSPSWRMPWMIPWASILAISSARLSLRVDSLRAISQRPTPHSRYPEPPGAASPLIVIPALLGVADDTATWNAEDGRKDVPDPSGIGTSRE